MLKVIFEDGSLLVLDKPPGLVVTSSETQSEPSLQDILAKEYKISAERSGIVHRLDKDTSGLLLVAKDDETLAALQAQFKSREVKKEYLALVHGFIEKAGKIEAPIARNPGDREKFVVVRPCKVGPYEATNARPACNAMRSIAGREAVTEYKPLELRVMSPEFMEKIFQGFTKIQFRKLRTMNYEQFTLLRCHPLTGRTHQIRVHLKYLGFGVVGDSKYGGRKTVRLDHRWVPRQFLHAAKLEFTHPRTGEKMSFESKLPEDLEKSLAVVGKL